MKKIFALIAQAIRMAVATTKKCGMAAWSMVDFGYRFIMSDWQEEDDAETPHLKRPLRDAGPRMAEQIIDRTADVAATLGSTALKSAATVGSAAFQATRAVATAVASVVPKVSIGGGDGGSQQLPQPQHPRVTPATQQLRQAIDGLLDLEHKVARDPRGLVYMYASADSEYRSKMDIRALHPQLQRWLLSLTDGEYKAIKQAGLKETIDHLDGIAYIDGLMTAPEPEAGSRAEMTANVRKNMRDRLSKMGMPGNDATPTANADLHAA